MFKEFFKNKFQDNEIKNIVCDILGNANLDQIESLICNLLQKHLQANVEEIIFLEPSAGAVFGFLLTNKQKVILKIYNKNISQSYLEKMNYIQGIFYGSDFPAPSLLSPIIPFNHTHAGFYEFLDGNKENGHDPLIIDELAKYLGRFSDIVDKHSFELIYSFMQESAKGKLWPAPHNVLFDFNKTRRGAGWITSKAIAAKKIINSSSFKKKLAHTDWDVKNTVFRNKKLVGVFDWDALGAMSEPEMVGRACAQFTADWNLLTKSRLRQMKGVNL